jgi:hypothetical protein
MILDFTNKWNSGDTLNIKFLNGDEALKDRLKTIALEWTKYANIKFNFDSDDDSAPIRIKFGDMSTDSKIGTDSLTYPIEEPTMHYMANNAGSLEKNKVLHEFGHILGLIHEQFHPEKEIKWNKEAAINYYKGNYNYTEEDCERNLFRKYLRNQCQFFEFDPNSIMMYPIPASITLNGSAYEEGSDLSESDKKYISMIYPFSPKPTIDIDIDKRINGNLSEIAQEDVYHFVVDPISEKRYYIQVNGDTEVLLSLFRYEWEDKRKGYIDYIKPIIDTTSEKESVGRNAKLELEEYVIKQKLPTIYYYIRVRHLDPIGTGVYEITLNAV